MRRLFDRLAPAWEARSSPEHLAPLAAALLHVHPSPERALDLGTGLGDAALLIAREFPQARVRGVDLSEEMVRRAQARIGLDPEGRVAFRVADAADLPYQDDSFDLVAQLNMPPFFAETARVLRPGGHFVIAASFGPRDALLHARIRAGARVWAGRARAGRERDRRRRHLLGGAAPALTATIGCPEAIDSARERRAPTPSARQPLLRGRPRPEAAAGGESGARAWQIAFRAVETREPRARRRGGAARRRRRRDPGGDERRRADRAGRRRPRRARSRRWGSFRAVAATTSPGSSGSRASPPARSRCSPRAASAQIDVGEVNGRRFLCIASFGFDSDAQPDRQRGAAGARQPRLCLRRPPGDGRLASPPPSPSPSTAGSR